MLGLHWILDNPEAWVLTALSEQETRPWDSQFRALAIKPPYEPRNLEGLPNIVPSAQGKMSVLLFSCSQLQTCVLCRFGVWIYTLSLGTPKPRNYQKSSLCRLTFGNQPEASANLFWMDVSLSQQRIPQINPSENEFTIQTDVYTLVLKKP